MAACGGGNDQPTAQPVAKPVVIAAPASEASAPVAASSPAASVPVASEAVASGPVEASAPVVASDPVPPRTVQIDVYGDDSMMGLTAMNYGMATITQNSEPNVSQKILRAQFPGVTIVNRASGGRASTLVNMMVGMDGGGPPFAQRIASSKAQIVLLNHAINDDLSQSLAPYTDALIQWIQDARNAGKVPVFEEPNPVCDGDHPHLENYVATMNNIAIGYNVPVIHQYQEILNLQDWKTHMWNCFLPDEYLLSFKAQRQAEALVPIVKAALGE
ncbi:hypothetical protein AB4Y32_15875 [Paraburkholderia phymatum]|uniref:Uncharacterized protein n=1 Tax=Paraburkholderia phymatum TaxID=148447 RepID=A0ACC6U125_9BURK